MTDSDKALSRNAQLEQWRTTLDELTVAFGVLLSVVKREIEGCAALAKKAGRK